MFRKITNPDVYGITPESPEHAVALEEVRKETMALLSLAGSHPNIVSLVGVVVDERARPTKLLFEWASCGDLERCVFVCDGSDGCWGWPWW